MADLFMTGNLSNDQLQTMKKMDLEALSLLSHANYEVNVLRKQLTESDIGKDYTYLCSVSDSLLWHAIWRRPVHKQLKDNGDQNKIVVKIQPKDYHSSNYNSYGSQYSHMN